MRDPSLTNPAAILNAKAAKKRKDRKMNPTTEHTEHTENAAPSENRSNKPDGLLWRFGRWWVKRCAEQRKREFAKLDGFSRDAATEAVCRELQARKVRLIWIVPVLFLGGVAVACLGPGIPAGIPVAMIFGGLALGVAIAAWGFVRCPHCGRRMRRLYLITGLSADGDDLWYVCDECRTCAFSGEGRGG